MCIRDRNQDYGKKAEEAAILDKVTVTETKDGQELSLIHI